LLHIQFVANNQLLIERLLFAKKTSLSFMRNGKYRNRNLVHYIRCYSVILNLTKCVYVTANRKEEEKESENRNREDGSRF